MDDDRHATSFEELIAATPGHLKTGTARIYNEIAMNLAGGEWRKAGLVKMGEQLAKGSGKREQWRVEPGELGGVPTAVHRRSASVEPMGRLLSMGRVQPRMPWLRGTAASAILREHRAESLVQRSAEGRLNVGMNDRATAVVRESRASMATDHV